MTSQQSPKDRLYVFRELSAWSASSTLKLEAACSFQYISPQNIKRQKQIPALSCTMSSETHKVHLASNSTPPLLKMVEYFVDIFVPPLSLVDEIGQTETEVENELNPELLEMIHFNRYRFLVLFMMFFIAKSMKHIAEAYLFGLEMEGYYFLLEGCPRLMVLTLLGTYLILLPTGCVTFSQVVFSIICFVVYRMFVVLCTSFHLAWLYLSLAGYNLLVPMLVTDAAKAVTSNQKLGAVLLYSFALLFSLFSNWGQTVTIHISWNIFSLVSAQLLILAPCAFYIYTADTNARLMVQELKGLLGVAKKASEAKVMFFSNVTHDLRTPIQAILGLINLVEHSELTSVQKPYLDSIKSSCQTLISIVNDVLDLSKFDNGKMHFVPHKVDLFKLVQDISDSMASLAEQKNLHFDLQIDVPMAHRFVESDQKGLSRVLTNLVSNAIKFTDSGHVVLRLSSTHSAHVECDEKSSSQNSSFEHFTFEIRDSGPGMSADFIKNRIFNPFSQEYQKGQTRRRGTGLGLSLSQKIVRELGGSIQVTSSLNCGSTFYFTLNMKIIPGEVAFPSFSETDAPFSTFIWNTQTDDLSEHRLAQYLDQWGGTFEPLTQLTFEEENIEKAFKMCSTNPKLCFIIQSPGISSKESETLFLQYLDSLINTPSSPWYFVLLSRPRSDSSYFQSLLARTVERSPCCKLYSLLLPITPLKFHECIAALLSHSRHVTNTNLEGNVTLTPSIELNGNEMAQDLDHLYVLIAEDNPILASIFSMFLQRHSISHVIANNGQIAIEKWLHSSKRFDAILMDVQMPVMDGFEAVENICSLEKQNGEQHPVHVIFMSANASLQDFERGKAVGGNEFLSKPVEFTSFVQSLRKVRKQE
jgi:signal transduction histidine kinase